MYVVELGAEGPECFDIVDHESEIGWNEIWLDFANVS